MTPDPWLLGIAWRLDRLRWVPSDVLDAFVRRDGACVGPSTDTQPPWLKLDLTDRELAAWLCADCTAHDECLELELRTAGANTVGVWGGLSEEDRRALYPLWLARGHRLDGRPGR